MRQVLSDIANIGSLFGLALTVYVTYIAQSVKRFHDRQYRVPRLLKDLKDYRASLGLMLRDASLGDSDLIEGSLTCAANLKALVPKLPRKIRSTPREVAALIHSLQTQVTRDQIARLHSKLEYVEAEVKNWMDDEMVGGSL